MGRFIGRERELSFLEDFRRNGFKKACAVIGRRQIGKSSLIDEFIKDKDHFKIEFAKTSRDTNLRLMSRTMTQFTGEEKDYSNPMDFLWDLAGCIKGRSIIVVFDEFPYMVDCDKEFAALTQYFIDMQLGDSKLIISGSSVKTMEYETKDYTRPLYGRTVPLYVDQMELGECAPFHPDMPDLEQLKLYLAVGGVPLYHQTDGCGDFRCYMERMILSPQAPFREEGEQMVNRELSPSPDYIKVLDSLRGRRNSIADITARTSFDRNLCAKYLKDMMALRMVSEYHPMWGAQKKPRYYAISDRMLASYYLVKRNDTSYGASPSEKYNALVPLLSTSRGLMFESFCTDLLCKSYPVREIGSWWGAGPDYDRWGNPRIDDEGNPVMVMHGIDIAADIAVGSNIVNLAVECKFSANPTGFEALNELDSSLRCLKTKRHTRRMIISPLGFTEELRDYAEQNAILLVDLDMIMSRRPLPSL